MEQRRLRLGDILDDYCPRERRLTNHAVVAMVEETVKQTRCTTCDAEHPYKGGQAPRRRKKDGPSALYKEVLAGKPDTDIPPAWTFPRSLASADCARRWRFEDGDVNGNVMAAGESRHAAIVSRPDAVVRREPVRAVAPRAAGKLAPEATATDRPNGDSLDDDNDQRVPDVEDGPVHRQLIRATLPRIEGHKEERRPTDFTIRQPGGRGNNAGNQFPWRGGGNDRMRSGGRGGPGGKPRQQGGNRRASRQRSPAARRPAVRRCPLRSGPGAGPGSGPGARRGQGGGFRSAQQPRHGGGGRKRSR